MFLSQTAKFLLFADLHLVDEYKLILATYLSLLIKGSVHRPVELTALTVLVTVVICDVESVEAVQILSGKNM